MYVHAERHRKQANTEVNAMQVKYNMTGARRKELVRVISETTGAKAEYRFMPTCNYEVACFTVTKDGTVFFDDSADSEEIRLVLEAVAAAGFECEPQRGAETAAEEVSQVTADKAPHGENRGLTVEIPLDKVSVGNLTKLLDVKGGLIKKVTCGNRRHISDGKVYHESVRRASCRHNVDIVMGIGIPVRNP